ncbi:MAG: acyl-CoA dehydrogenase family protein [Pirellulaceae bacterium]
MTIVRASDNDHATHLPTLPTDEVRQVLWRFESRQDLRELVRLARSAARGPVARLVADGERNTNQWTDAKSSLLVALDDAKLSGLLADCEDGGSIDGPKNLALALAVFELSWVDGGAATTCLALWRALGAIALAGTSEQARYYLARSVPQPGDPDRVTARGAFCLTEPLPHAGVDLDVAGTVRIAEWQEGQDPILEVEKRGRFTGNMDFANFVVAAVASADPKFRGTCMIILEESDEGAFDRGSTARKVVHQLASTRDPVFRLKVPASRIVGGYTIQDGVLIPNRFHTSVVNAIVSRTRISVALMTAAKLVSSIEPILRYQRERFGVEVGVPGSPIQQTSQALQEDALHRLVDVWSAGEASASFGFAAARHFDAWEPLDQSQKEIYAAAGAKTSVERHKARQAATRRALEYLHLSAEPEDERDENQMDELGADRLVMFLLHESVAAVLSPAAKLWNTRQGALMLRDAVSLMGGCGLMEQCPGFLPQKWMDAQLEATYEGPEYVQRRQLVVTMTNELFLAQFEQWIGEMRRIAGKRPGSGACALGTAMDLWLWTLRHLQDAKDANGRLIFRDRRQGATFPMADALCWLLAARYQILDTMQLASKRDAAFTEYADFFADLCHVQTARAAGEAGRICAELVYGYNRHPRWDPDCGSCMNADEIDSLEGVIPGISVGARIAGDVMEADGSHDVKRGPCVRFAGLYEFVRRRNKLDGCLTGVQLAKDRAARALQNVAIPDQLDYPA